MTHSQAPADLVTKPEAAEILRVSTRTIDRYLANGTLPFFKTGTGLVRIERGAVVAQLTPSSPVEPTSSPGGSAGAFVAPESRAS